MIVNLLLVSPQYHRADPRQLFTIIKLTRRTTTTIPAVMICINDLLKPISQIVRRNSNLDILAHLMYFHLTTKKTTT
jgi:hypothetical protein